MFRVLGIYNFGASANNESVYVTRIRGVINSKMGKAAALPKFLDMLTLSQSGGADYAQLALFHLKYFVITPLRI